MAEMMAIMKGEDDYSHVEKRYLRKDGQIVWGEVTISLIRDSEANAQYFLAIIQDITERKAIEEQLRENEARFRRLHESMMDCFVQMDMPGKIGDFNPAYREMLGYPAEELYQLCSPDLTPACWHAFEQSIVEEEILPLGHSKVYEKEYIRKDGSVFPVELRAFLLRDPTGTPTGMWAIVRDITARKQTEQRIRDQNAELERRVEARTRELGEAQEKLIRQEKLAVMGQLAGGVGHELRNPLGVINNATYYLRLLQPEMDEKVREYLGIIETETHTAEKIINDLLDFSRIKSVDPEPFSAAEIVRRALDRYPVPQNIAVILKLPEALPPCYADPRQVVQVLGNLVVNACQAMPEGGKLALTGRKKGKMLAISVSDSGVGIQPENMGKLFEPLYTTKPKGIGLGLAVSKKLIEANGGRIEVTSVAGKGSVFTVLLPKKTMNMEAIE
jgi:PAS domain S-box-containing protein